MNAAFAAGYSHDAVDGEAVVRVFVEEEILSAFGGRPILRRFAQCRIFDQFFEQLLALFHSRFHVGKIRPRGAQISDEVFEDGVE
jgi:hypothetical protein